MEYKKIEQRKIMEKTLQNEKDFWQADIEETSG